MTLKLSEMKSGRYNLLDTTSAETQTRELLSITCSVKTNHTQMEF